MRNVVVTIIAVVFVELVILTVFLEARKTTLACERRDKQEVWRQIGSCVDLAACHVDKVF